MQTSDAKTFIISVHGEKQETFYFMFAMRNCFLSNDESSAVGGKRKSQT
jgi:hypothetical protein